MSLPYEYRVVDRIAATTSSELSRARLLKNGATVLIKRADPSAVVRFRNEYQLLRSLAVAGVAKPIALVDDLRQPAMVMEDFAGESFETVLSRVQRIDWPTALAIGRSLAQVLEALHAKHLVHQDIHPANILLDVQSGQVCLVDCSLAREPQLKSQATHGGEHRVVDWAYVSPEQTGRTNQPVDSRSDFYSLGIILYRLLTGRLPFKAEDPIEWAYCHIARTPPPPHTVSEGIPSVVSDIVMRLLAKAPQDRYQSSRGLSADIDRCLTQWQSCGQIGRFPLGEEDFPDQFQVPERLYGRDAEVAELLAAFDRVAANGHPEVITVSGYAGIGKSAIVHQLRKPIAHQGGYFITGKFDQYHGDIPYVPVTQGLHDLVQQLLGESDERIAQWRQDIQVAVGVNGQIILDVLPQIELIIGPQPPVASLPAREQEHRFRVVFRQFVDVFCRKDHPVVFFLDDVQWIDAASLKLIEYLITHPDTRYLLLVVAYRDNELGSAHPLLAGFSAIRTGGVHVTHLEVPPLSGTHLNRLVVDTLHAEASACESLTRLIVQRTGGNPFFFIQFLDSLYQEGLLRHSAELPGWTWDLKQIERKDFAANVVDLMVAKLRRLAPATQRVLMLAACLGNRFDGTGLALADGQPRSVLEEHLSVAVREGLITYADGVGKFLHDRIQQAAYELIPEAQRLAIHLMIGRALWTRAPAEWIDRHLLEIVSQLNRSAELIGSLEERIRVAELNLRASRRAKQSTAYGAALNYAAAGEALLPEEHWEQQYRLRFELSLLRAECEFLTGALEDAESRLFVLWRYAATSIDRAAVTCLRIDVNATWGRMPSAVEACLDYLRGMSIDWTPHPTEGEIQREYRQLCIELGSRSIEALIDLPQICDPEWQATLGVFAMGMPAALFTDPNLSCLMACRFVRLSLKHGHSEVSCVAYVWLAMILGPYFGEYRTAARFGHLAYGMAERQPLNRFQARVYLCFADYVVPWTKHLLTGRPLYRRAFELANRTGDVLVEAGCRVNLVSNQLASGDPLGEVQVEAERALVLAREARYGLAIATVKSHHQLIRQLRGVTAAFSSLNDAAFDEEGFERELEEAPSLAPAAYRYWIRKLQSRVFAGDYRSALEAAAKAESLTQRSRWFFEVTEYRFFAALAHAQAADTAAPEERAEHLDAVRSHQRQLANWAAHSPENLENRAALVAAELARLEARDLDAIMCGYEQARQSAREHGFVQNEALVNELAARCLLARGFQTAAKGFLEAAHAAYARWGAEGKVRQLEEIYPQLRAQPGAARQRAADLDLLSVAKASQAISGKIVLSELIDTLMRITIESAGAQTGYLLLVRGDTVVLAAEAHASRDTVDVRLHQEVAVPELLVPSSVVNYVHRSRTSVLLPDTAEPHAFSGDPYFARENAKSVLCIPIVNQTALVGLLYLQNDLFPHAFTPERLTVLELLGSQVAISIGSARLYADLQQENQDRRRAERSLREREARIRRLVESNIVGIMFWTLDGRITAANEAMLQIIGYSLEDLLSGRIGWTDLTPAEYRALDERALEQLQRTGAVAPFEKEYIHRDGHRVPVLLGVAAFEDSPEAGVAFVLDLTERKQAEADRHARQVAEAANRAKSEFLSRVSHDLRTPLNGILGYAQVLRKDTTLGDRQRERVKVIQDSGEHLLQLIEDILDLAKIEAGRLELRPAELVLPRFLSLISQIISVEAEQKGLVFIRECANDLPGRVRADGKRLRQVLLNLLGNAVKFTEKGTIRLEVCAPVPGRLRFAVHDTGIGIAADQLERIFEPFEQLGEDRLRAAGTGLGLAISRQFVQLMGGELHAKSEPGVGSTFWFELEVPIISAVASTHEPASPMPEYQPARPMPTPPSALLARLHCLALEGNMRDVAEEARRIASLDERYQPFANKLQLLAKAYQSQAILRLIEDSRRSEPCPMARDEESLPP